MPITQVAPEPSVSPVYPSLSLGPNDTPGVADISAARDTESNRSALNANHSSDSPTTDSTIRPRTDESRDQYSVRLNGIRRKQVMLDACSRLGLNVTKSANLEKLREVLTSYWFPEAQHVNHLTSTSPRVPPTLEAASKISTSNVSRPHRKIQSNTQDESDDEEDTSDKSEDDKSEDDKSEDDDAIFHEDFAEFKRRVRVEETRRAEGNRRAGGLKTQKAMVKAWQEFVSTALEKGEIQDDIIDEHHLLLYLRFCSERPKRSRQGVDIPGTFVGASQIKKLYFGALRIRKEQEANDPTLVDTRPPVTIHVHDALRGRLNEARTRNRSGLVPGEDAPDIVANTFLDSITDEQLVKVGLGFLSHREIRCVINGHLAWTCQHASGNRGDDFRSLKIAELQPYTLLHPNRRTQIQCVLACQGEEKAGAGRGMHTVRLLHTQKSPVAAFSEQSLYKLYVHAFDAAGFSSSIKAHLPRHVLGMRQEKLGVDPLQTSRLGWTRGETYFDNYAPAIPKPAVLACHGFKEDEVYDPIWTHVHVPEQFKSLICPMAEDIHSQIVGKPNLTGAANYWSMIIWLRPFFFQGGASIYQLCPESALFKLPAFQDPDVKNWMKIQFPKDLSLLKISAKDPIEFERVQNDMVRQALSRSAAIVESSEKRIIALAALVERRTQVLSPTKGYSHERYQGSVSIAQSSFKNKAFQSSHDPIPDVVASAVFPIPSSSDVYVSEDDGMLRAYVNGSPKTPRTPSNQHISNDRDLTQSPLRERTQVDFVLPHASAFTRPGENGILWPPVLGQNSVTWDQIFPLIRRPEMLWECWRPLKTLDKYTLEEQWVCYDTGEHILNSAGISTGIKPPLRKVEMYFGASWRKEPAQKKAWERFREIPSWVENQCASRGVAPQSIHGELKEWASSQDRKIGLAALSLEVKARRERAKTLALESQQGLPAMRKETDETLETKKRRMAPIDPRQRPKKRKFGDGNS